MVHDGNVAEVADGFLTSAEGAAERDEIEIIDLKDKFVLPGLMDMHVHLTMSKLSRSRENQKGADAYQVIEGMKNARKTVEAGYTTVRNVGASGYATFALRDAIEAGDIPGPRILTAGHTLVPSADEEYSGACYSPESCRKAVRRQIDMGVDMIKIYVTCSGSQPCGREEAPSSFRDDELVAIVETASTRELPVAAHAHSTAGVNAALRAGVDSVEHGSYNDVESHKLFKKSGAYLVSTLSVEDQIEKDYETAEGAMREVMEGFMANHPDRAFAAYKAGVTLATGSDAGVTEHGGNARELEWLVKIGLSEMEAIKAATVNTSRLIRMEDKLGTVEAGKIADLIAVDGNPLNEIAALGHINFVMKDGHTVLLK